MCSLVLKRLADLRSHRKTCIWLSGHLVKDFLNYFYYYGLVFYHYILLQMILPPRFAIFWEVFWQNAFWKIFEGSLILVKPGATELQRYYKEFSLQVFSCEFANSFFIEHLWITRVKAVYTTEKDVLLFQRISQIDWKIPVIQSFILTLQARRPAILLKKTSSNMFSCNLDDAFQKIISQSSSQGTISLIIQILANLLNA